MTGPSNGPRELRDIAVPLLSTGITSAIVPLPQVIVATPATPARNRKVINIPIFVATAEAIVKMRNSTLHVWYTGIRPYISLSGASNKGPNAKPRMKTETTNVARILDVLWNSVMTCGTPGANIDDARGLQCH